MADTEQNQTPGDASGEKQPQPTPSGAQPAPKLEVRDNTYYIDGKKVVYESDLIAAKHSLESKLESTQSAHEQAIDAARLELSEAQRQVANLNVQLQEAQQARESGATVDVAKIEQELAAAKGSVETLQQDAAKALEYRREMIATKYSIPVDSLQNKDMKQLDSFEEALKAVSTSRGTSPGPYAVGAVGGTAEPMTDMDRARRLIDATPVRGTRNEPPAQ